MAYGYVVEACLEGMFSADIGTPKRAGEPQAGTLGISSEEPHASQ